MRIVDCQQGTGEWLAARCGKVGASRVHEIVAKTKTGPSALRANYHAELVAERLTGAPAEKFVNDAMRWGIEQESAAREMYAFARGIDVAQVGLVLHPVISMAMASPDGLVGDDGLVEIKCPGTAKHIATLLGEPVDNRYMLQMQWQMACTGRAWCDFVSFDPRMPPEMQMEVRRIERHEPTVKDLEVAVVLFLEEVEATVRQLTEKFREAA